MTFCFVNFTYTQICSFVYGIFFLFLSFPSFFFPLSLYVPRRAGVPAQSWAILTLFFFFVVVVCIRKRKKNNKDTERRRKKALGTLYSVVVVVCLFVWPDFCYFPGRVVAKRLAVSATRFKVLAPTSFLFLFFPPPRCPSLLCTLHWNYVYVCQSLHKKKRYEADHCFFFFSCCCCFFFFFEIAEDTLYTSLCTFAIAFLRLGEWKAEAYPTLSERSVLPSAYVFGWLVCLFVFCCTYAETHKKKKRGKKNISAGSSPNRHPFPNKKKWQALHVFTDVHTHTHTRRCVQVKEEGEREGRREAERQWDAKSTATVIIIITAKGVDKEHIKKKKQKYPLPKKKNGREEEK